jgi:transcriptional regulator with XRE-family HTH domain
MNDENPLQTIGQRIRQQRKLLKVQATHTAQAAGVSRVTLHRIEKGELGVSAGAYESVLEALGLSLAVQELSAGSGVTTAAAPASGTPSHIPVSVMLQDYPQLQSLAWHLPHAQSVSALQAWQLYERNARHVDMALMSPQEQALYEALRVGLGDGA